MEETTYLIAGSSHAALAAVDAIRHWDTDGGITVITRDTHLPYSPTVLPYVVSGRSAPDRVALRDEADFSAQRVEFRRGAALAAVQPGQHTVTLADGSQLRYGKLLLATGAAPQIPPIPGLAGTPYQVLRTLDDALALREQGERVHSAIVLGAGLIGMHAAENLAKAGVAVTVVEREPRVLAGYFDDHAAGIIQRTFTANGVTMVLGKSAAAVSQDDADAIVLSLGDGTECRADLLLVATGVAPRLDYLADAGVATEQGILVDDTMRTSIEDIWAAGDVAQARSFYDDTYKVMNGILPDAVEQGRIAGMAMAGDPAVKPYPGAVPLNTYTFFGQQAVSVGSDRVAGAEVVEQYEPDQNRYRKLVLHDGRLMGAAGINTALDPGVLWQLILRRIDLTPVREEFLAQPLRTGRVLMSQTWR